MISSTTFKRIRYKHDKEMFKPYHMYCKTKLCKKKKIQVKGHDVISPLTHYIALRLFDYVYLTAFEMAMDIASDY